MVVLPTIFLLGSLFLCGGVEAQTTADLLRPAALKLKGTVTCDKWDCSCSFSHQRGCCCGAQELYQLEGDTYARMENLSGGISRLNSRIQALTAGMKIAFKATIDPNLAIAISGFSERCFGPFTTNMPIPYASITFNDGRGYNPSLGVFTAPLAGVYVFSLKVYSSVEENGRLYHKVQLIWNGRPMSNVWEDNREDSEDSATQILVVELQKGDQVYVELMSGRRLCKNLEYNIFTGHILYPYINE